MVYDDGPEYNQEQETVGMMVQDAGVVSQLNRSEIDIQIATAKKWPRSVTRAVKTATELVSHDPQMAEECIYALTRKEKGGGSKLIEGPSARFAEIMAYSWTNNRAGARTIAEEEQFITAQGMFHDLETNVAIQYEVRRKITGKDGKRYSADMVGTTASAANSIALRNAVLKGIPKAIWWPIYQAARSVVAGDIRTLASRRDAALKAFQLHNVKPEQLFTLLDINGIEELNSEHLVTLRGILTAIKDGETTAEQVFSPRLDEELAAKSKANVERIKERYKDAPGPKAGQVGPATSAPVHTGDAGPARSAPPVEESGMQAPAPAPETRMQEKVAEMQDEQQTLEPDPSTLVSSCFLHGEYKGDECPKCKAGQTEAPKTKGRKQREPGEEG